jgi:hypothetical protein
MKCLLFTSFAVLLLACKKQTPDPVCTTTFVDAAAEDSIDPSPYLAAWPGSEWHYDDGSSITCSSWGLFGIREVSTSSSTGCKAITTTQTPVPQMTYFGPIYGNSQLVAVGDEANTQFRQLLAETPGLFYSRNYTASGGSGTNKRSVVEVLPSMTVNGVDYTNVIHVHERDSLYYLAAGSGPRWSKHYYFASEVGLVREITDYTQASGSITERNLVSYVIGPH